jgi:hypothetical protein
VLIASDPNSIGEWSAFAGIMLVLAGLVGYLLRESRRRGRARREAAEEIVAVIPSAYRYRVEPLWFRALGLGGPLVALLVGGAALGETAGFLACAGVGGPALTAALLNRCDHRRAVIAEVSERAPAMEPTELRRLVDALEFHYGEEIRPLRRLVPETA